MAYIRKIILALGLILSAVLAGTLAAQSEPVLGHISGFPVFPGLVEVEDAGVIFDKAEGRIVEAMLRGEADATEVRSFYLASLRQTGWRQVMIPCGGSKLVFVRDGELLEISLEEADGALEISVYLAPNDSGL